MSSSNNVSETKDAIDNKETKSLKTVFNVISIIIIFAVFIAVVVMSIKNKNRDGENSNSNGNAGNKSSSFISSRLGIMLVGCGIIMFLYILSLYIPLINDGFSDVKKTGKNTDVNFI